MRAKLFLFVFVASLTLAATGGVAPVLAQSNGACDLPLEGGNILPDAIENNGTFELADGTTITCNNGTLYTADGSVFGQAPQATVTGRLGGEVCATDPNGNIIWRDDIVNDMVLTPAQQAEFAADGFTENSLIHNGAEPCAWLWNGYPFNLEVVIPLGVVATVHVVDEDVARIYVGDGETVVNIWRGTFRVVAGYPETDPVHTSQPCTLVADETSNGHWSIRNFHVLPGNFECPGVDFEGAPVGNTSEATMGELSCPMFAEVQTTALTDASGCKLEYVQNRVLTGVVPNGWTAEYWDGKVVQTANAGSTITTGEATFRQAQ